MYEIIDFIVKIAEQFWYTGVFFMMLLESSFFPFPSAAAMIPAWYLASTWQMNFTIALTVWTLWALIGATINYVLWYYLWDKVVKNLIQSYWKYFLISMAHYNKTETYFQKHWSITTFLARFITVVRQLISIPAWVFKMNFAKFLFYTGLWAWLWNLVLMSFWYMAGENREMIKQYSFELLMWWLLFVVFVWLTYFYLNKNRK